MADDPPPIKPWGKHDKKKLQYLINKGKIDTGRTTDTRYIRQIRIKHFRERDNHNFRRNFRNYVRSFELEDQLSGYRRRQGKFVILL